MHYGEWKCNFWKKSQDVDGAKSVEETTIRVAQGKVFEGKVLNSPGAT